MVSPPKTLSLKKTHNKWLYLGTDFLRRAGEERRRALISYDPKGPHLASATAGESLRTYYTFGVLLPRLPAKRSFLGRQQQHSGKKARPTRVYYKNQL